MTVVTKQKRASRPQSEQTDYFVPPHAVQPKRPSSPPSPSSHFWRNSLLALSAALGLGLLWTMRQPVMEMLALVGDQAAVSAYLQGFGIWGPLVLAVVQFIQIIVAVIPGHVFLIAAGYVYGFSLGLLLNVIFIVAASQFTYSLARWAGRPLVSRFVDNDKLEHWYKIGEKQGFIFFTIIFVLPVFPTDVMNFVAGLTGIPPRKFLAANFLGRLPGAIILTLIGSHGLQWSSSTWAALSVLVISVYVLGRLAIRRIEQKHK